MAPLPAPQQTRRSCGSLLATAAVMIPVLVPQLSFSGNAFVTGYFDAQIKEEPGSEVLAGFAQNTDPAKRWKMFEFPEQAVGLGDAAVTPFGDEVEYKVNAVNFNLYFGDKKKLPFQLYMADLASNQSPGEANESKLLDPTQGFAVQIPIAGVYKGKDDSGGFCNFTELKGYCVIGGDVTLRGVRLSETNDAGDVNETSVFGGSASLRAATLFPIFKTIPGSDQAGHLSFGLGARYYYHNTDKQNLLFGEITDPDGTAIEFKKSFGAFSAESEFDIYKHFKFRLEYYRPFGNRDVLDDVFKFSIVVAPEQ